MTSSRAPSSGTGSTRGCGARPDDGTRYFVYGGDFGENTPSDRNFLLNGLVTADRRPQPHLLEVKKVYQPVAIRAIDLAAGEIEIENRYAFTSLASLDGSMGDRGRRPDRGHGTDPCP